jgi:predicted dehydrogenase
MQRFLSPAQAPKVIHILVNAGLLPPEHWLHDPEQGGGRIIGEGCHFIDFAAFLAGAAPDWISAQALPDQAPYRQDNVVLNLGFADGSLATIHYLANGDRSLPKEYVEVFCAGRVARLYDFRRLETAYDGRQNTQRLRGRQDKGHTAIWETFAEAIRQGGPPPIPYPILFAVTQASFDALRALRAGERIPIRLPDQN